MSERIRIPSAFEAVRRRPGMYVGNTDDGSGLHHLLSEVLSNCCDQIAAGSCTEVQVEILEDHSVKVQDNGPGWLDIDIAGVPILTKAVTELHESASLTGHAPHDHAGIHGVGIFVVVALSEFVRIQTCRDGVERLIETRDGRVYQPELRRSTEGRVGTIVHFRPDPALFSNNINWNGGWIDRRIRELAVLLQHANWTFRDGRVLSYPKRLPLASLIIGYAIANEADSLHGSVLIDAEDVVLDWSILWRSCFRHAPIGFVNWLPVHQGSHIQALKQAVRQFLVQRLGEDCSQSVERHLNLACRIRVSNPRFAEPSTETLSRADLEPVLLIHIQKSVADAIDAKPDWTPLRSEYSGSSPRA